MHIDETIREIDQNLLDVLQRDLSPNAVNSTGVFKEVDLSTKGSVHQLMIFQTNIKL